LRCQARQEETVAEQSTVRTNREQTIMMAKVAVGIVVGAVFATIVGPILLAIIVGLADGH
jgi:hypothetical protein